MIPQPAPAPQPGPLQRRIADAQPKPPPEKWQPAWLKRLPARDESGRLAS